MNKIEVDEAMRKRILSYVENLNLETEKPAKSREESKIRQFRRRTVRNITAAAALYRDPSGMYLRLAEAHGTGRTGNERKRKHRERHGGSKIYR